MWFAQNGCSLWVRNLMILLFGWFWVVGARFFKSRSAIYGSNLELGVGKIQIALHHMTLPLHGRVSSLQQPWVSQKWCPRIHWTMIGRRGSVQFLSRLISLYWVNVKWPWCPKRCERCGANEMNPIDIQIRLNFLSPRGKTTVLNTGSNARPQHRDLNNLHQYTGPSLPLSFLLKGLIETFEHEILWAVGLRWVLKIAILVFLLDN